MKKYLLLFSVSALSLSLFSQGLIPVPNNDFESWINYGGYENPEFWDTPNEETTAIPVFGTTVVERSTDCQSGLLSARLETKTITLIGEIPGVVTLGELGINLSTLSYTLEGGIPINDKPHYLRGFYKYLPKGGDSCAIGIGLMHWNGTHRDSVGYGVFSTHAASVDWAPFAAVIEYEGSDLPDTMNILAISSAMDAPTAGTVLFVDGLWLDYAVTVDEDNPGAGIEAYVDRETKRILIFPEFNLTGNLGIMLYDMTGKRIFSESCAVNANDRVVVPYGGCREGIYILEVLNGQKRFTKKIYLVP